MAACMAARVPPQLPHTPAFSSSTSCVTLCRVPLHFQFCKGVTRQHVKPAHTLLGCAQLAVVSAGSGGTRVPACTLPHVAASHRAALAPDVLPEANVPAGKRVYRPRRCPPASA